jgi:hypothetical protein
MIQLIRGGAGALLPPLSSIANCASEYKDTKMQKCKNAKMQKCKNAIH